MTGFLTAAALASAIPSTQASDVGGFFGVTYSFGEKNRFGITAQVTTSNKEDKWIGAGGLAFYPFEKNNKFGLPIGGGFQGESLALIGGYDLLQERPFVALGSGNIRKDKTTGTVIPAPAPAPPPP